MAATSRTDFGLQRDAAAELNRLVASSADPDLVLHQLGGIRDACPDVLTHVLTSDAGRHALVTVLAASRSLGMWLRSHPDELASLHNVGFAARLPPLERLRQDALRAIGTAAEPADELRVWKRRHLLRIALRDLMMLSPLAEVGANLADLADACLEAALVLAQAGNETDVRLAVVAMGKHGGRELNYSSDVDVLFVSEDGSDPQQAGRAARRLLEIMGGLTREGIVWRVDADLRPEGRSGVLVRSLGAYLAYYRRWADTWEFQALIKRRSAAGDADLGARFVAETEGFVYPETLPPEAVDELRSMKARAEAQVASAGVADRQVKLGPGGIRDVEFAVQLLQLVHGRSDTGIRSPNTLTALTQLSNSGYIDPFDADVLGNSYIKLRTVEHRLQLEDEAQVHTLPQQAAQLERLARILRYRPTTAATAAEQFMRDFRADVVTVRSVHERLFYRPLLEAFATRRPGAEEARPEASGETAGAGISTEAAEERMRVFGFANTQATRRALEALTSGLSRRSKLMEATLPLILEWLSDAPDPDLGLLMLQSLMSSSHRAERLMAVFRDSPLAAQRLCTLLASSRPVGTGLQRFPEFILLLEDDRRLRHPKTRDELQGGVMRQLAWREDEDARLRGLRRFVLKERTRISMRDLLGLSTTAEVAAEMTALAEACLEGALVTAGEADLPPVAVIGMGSLGGGELTYGSDLDILIAYDGPKEAFSRVERTAESLLRTIGAPTQDGRAFDIDLDLRPEGKSGVLTRTVPAYEQYWERWADTWEFQALLKARHVAGDPDVGAAFLTAAARFVYVAPFPRQRLVDVRKMKARIDRSRIPRGKDPSFHMKLGRGGLVDIEFAVQLLQLRHGALHTEVRQPGTQAAIGALRFAGILDADAAQRLQDAHAGIMRFRNRLTLLGARDPDMFPTAFEDSAKLARSLGYLDAPVPTLREEYRRMTRQARQAADAILYPDDRPPFG